MNHDLIQRLKTHGNMGDKWTRLISHEAADRITELEQQLANRDKQIVMLRDAIGLAACVIDSDRYPSVFQNMQKALDATQDLSNAVLCDANEKYVIEEITEDGKRSVPVYARRKS